MSKTISNELKTHLALEVTTLATCWRIIRVDAEEFFFTDHDTDIVYDGDTYLSAKGALPSSLQQTGNLAVDNMEAMTFLDPSTIQEDEVQAGLFDYASVDVFVINYADTSMGVLYLAQDWKCGNFTISDNIISAEIRGKAQQLSQQVGDLYSPSCRATLGDTQCGVDLDDSAGTYRHEGVVTSITEAQIKFTDDSIASGLDDSTFRYGLIVWSTPGSGDTYPGANAGFSMEIKSYDQGTDEFTLFEAMPNTINVDDEFTAYYGCDKALTTCRDKFDNVNNFRGEPYLPGSDAVLKVHGRRSEVR